ncbi:MAG: DUF3006 domain-containing protein [Eubacteriales bacterium]
MDLKIIIRLPDKLVDALDDIADDLYDDFKGKYCSKDQFWITLKDIKNADNFTLRQIKAALKTVTSKVDPFTIYCDELMFTDPRKRSSLVYSLKGFTNKLYTLHQNIENTLYTRQIERDDKHQSPNILIAEKVSYRQLPFIKMPDIPIEVVSIEIVEEKKGILKSSYEKQDEFPLFGGHLFIKRIEGDKVVCENSFGKLINFDILEMPKDCRERDVIIKMGNHYTVDQNETRVRAIQEQIKRESKNNKLK